MIMMMIKIKKRLMSIIFEKKEDKKLLLWAESKNIQACISSIVSNRKYDT